MPIKNDVTSCSTWRAVLSGRRKGDLKYVLTGGPERIGCYKMEPDTTGTVKRTEIHSILVRLFYNMPYLSVCHVIIDRVYLPICHAYLSWDFAPITISMS